jgi:hypothetical protein
MISFNQYGWFNATEVAKLHDKDVFEWTRLPSTISYIKALESTYGKIPYVKTSKARSDRGGGTWMHPKLAIVFARWLSAEFAIWCDEQIEGIIFGGRAAQHLKESELHKKSLRKQLVALLWCSFCSSRFNCNLHIAFCRCWCKHSTHL